MIILNICVTENPYYYPIDQCRVTQFYDAVSQYRVRPETDPADFWQLSQLSCFLLALQPWERESGAADWLTGLHSCTNSADTVSVFCQGGSAGGSPDNINITPTTTITNNITTTSRLWAPPPPHLHQSLQLGRTSRGFFSKTVRNSNNHTHPPTTVNDLETLHITI